VFGMQRPNSISLLQMKRCKVNGCRHSYAHVTSAHICGDCGEKGHGRMECKSEEKKMALQPFLQDRLPAWGECKIEGCVDKDTHVTRCHPCNLCGNVCGREVCDICNSKTCPLCRVQSVVDPSYTVFTSSSCVVCMEEKTLCIFRRCRHACVCADCLLNMD